MKDKKIQNTYHASGFKPFSNYIVHTVFRSVLHSFLSSVPCVLLAESSYFENIKDTWISSKYLIVFVQKKNSSIINILIQVWVSANGCFMNGTIDDEQIEGQYGTILLKNVKISMWDLWKPNRRIRPTIKKLINIYYTVSFQLNDSKLNYQWK